MTGTVTALLRRAGKVTAGAGSAVLAARLGLPALGAVVFLAVLAAGVGCWVISSDARAERVSRMLLAWRGNVTGRGSATVPEPPAQRPRRWPWLQQL